ncbi:ubiquitin carboxyl-terminal hydrolase 47 isoform X1 [Halyomorpha halys]|uniref:ubiquitin carboxyl-terminal hydrolase 47 isoform X1 n=2 Tax=Halyomorpha halys TaxID=286706 RepID=UPI0006D4EF4A|nr:ubiquitin carboxyl-terminal hydrolase 47-like isoform X1 [Halyomorpha halys]XP_014289721.1 ubiquitin carboxyl-terminal hydrolase 47-like isoform X1 [Halyomorpha halys]
MCFQGMVCVAQELRVECIVHNCASTVGKEKLEVTFPASTSVHTLISHVAQKMNYDPNSFQLTLQTRDAITRVFTEKTQGSLESAGLCTEPGARNALFLEGIGGNSKTLVKVYNCAKTQSNTDSENAAVTSPPPPDQFPTYQLPALRPPTASPATEYTFTTPLIRHETGYVGLVNQAMTCYLNSLLQALFMTPEFRNALYKWQFDVSHSSSPSKCIPFQLQKLFLNLQTSSKTAVETTELTKSFGWESGEVWQQHDIQELCRVMFDALEQEFKDTEQADLINQLYQGKMTDYVKCLECGTEKFREDTFLDIPLPVRPFGSTVAYGSVEEALRAFVQPETLEGNNQYFCDVCGKKCDAHKGLKFTKFPYLLTLHLKRFDFDYSTMHRIKLNDKLVFPEILDLNNFVKSNNPTNETDGECQEMSTKCDDSSTADSALDEDTSHAVESQNNDIDQEEDEGIDLSSNSGNIHENEKNKLQYMNIGPFVYELYSIMIHSGSASGGHYYAYIKDFAKGEWFCFNDQSVTSITHEDIKKTYGGSGGSARGYYSGAYSSSTNAYMLMYRQINKDLNCMSMVEEEFPPHIKKLLEEIKEIEEREKAIRAKQEEMVRIKVHTAHPLIGPSRSNKMYCHNDLTLAEVKSMAYSYLKLEGIVSEDQCRLVTYNKSQDEMEESLDGREKETIGEVFSSLRYTNSYDLFLEIRDKDKTFLPYNIGDVNLTVYICNLEKEEIESVHQIRTTPCQNISELKKLLQNYISLKSAEMHLVLIKPTSLEYMSDSNDLPLNKLGFSAYNRVFICPQGPEGDISKTFQNSDLYKLLDEVKNVITLHLSLPDNRKEALELLLIPPLVEETCTVNGEEKPSDSTPTGEGLPLTNGIEEEPGYSSGAGGTSDQSTSEDSSLTDSERTIIGEVINECPLSSPSDSDQQLSSSDSHTPAKVNQVNGEAEETWDSEHEHVIKNYYFKASLYNAEDGQRMLRVVVDKNIDVAQLKKKLEKYLGVASRFMKLMKGPEGQEITCSLRWCKDDERITVKLERVLSEGEQRITVNHLVLTAPNPVQYICDWIVKNGTPISTLKKDLLREVEKRAGLKIPYERCRLREQNWKNPGEVLRDTGVWDEGTIMSRQRIEVYLQELDGPEPVTNPHQVLLFARRWYPSTLSLGPFEEIVVDSSSATNLSKKLSEVSGIPVEHIKFVKGKTSFPCDMSVMSISHLFWESDSEWKYDWEREDGAVIFYRDSREELKSLSKEEQEASSKESTGTSNSSPYISGYSPRKERALKIYLDTTPRRARSVVDVD